MIAAQIEDGIVVRALVLPDDVEPTPYLAALNIGGEWVATDGPVGRGWVLAQGLVRQPWVQIAGAGGGPAGAEDGFPVGAEAARDGIVWRSRTQFNVNEPRSDGVPTTWSRVDGRFVVPAGWQYQPGEDLTADDGATWWRVVQATSFSPTDFPAAYVQVDGSGGEPVVVVPSILPWVQPQPGVPGREPYGAGARVTHGGRTWTSTIANNVWEPGVFGWSPD